MFTYRRRDEGRQRQEEAEGGEIGSLCRRMWRSGSNGSWAAVRRFGGLIVAVPCARPPGCRRARCPTGLRLGSGFAQASAVREAARRWSGRAVRPLADHTSCSPRRTQPETGGIHGASHQDTSVGSSSAATRAVAHLHPVLHPHRAQPPPPSPQRLPATPCARSKAASAAAHARSRWPSAQRAAGSRARAPTRARAARASPRTRGGPSSSTRPAKRRSAAASRWVRRCSRPTV